MRVEAIKVAVISVQHIAKIGRIKRFYSDRQHKLIRPVSPVTDCFHVSKRRIAEDIKRCILATHNQKAVLDQHSRFDRLEDESIRFLDMRPRQFRLFGKCLFSFEEHFSGFQRRKFRDYFDGDGVCRRHLVFNSGSRVLLSAASRQA